jgi:hypothetical protein
MSSIKIKDDAYGQEFVLLTGIDLTGATALKMRFEPPSGAPIEVTATDGGTPADGELHWTSTTGFFTSTGDWWLIGKITFAAAVLLTSRQLVTVTSEFNS